MIAAIELAILQQLAAASAAGALGYDFVVRETFPDDLEEYLKAKANLRTPAAWTVFLGMDQGSESDDGFTARCRFALVVAAQNQRNEQDSRHGDGSKPGSYQLAIDAARILSGNDLGLALMSAIAVRGARLVNRTTEMARQRLSAMALELDCRVLFGRFDPSLGEFLEMHVDWDVPVHGNVATPLPADTADAADLIEVPQ